MSNKASSPTSLLPRKPFSASKHRFPKSPLSYSSSELLKLKMSLLEEPLSKTKGKPLCFQQQSPKPSQKCLEESKEGPSPLRHSLQTGSSQCPQLLRKYSISTDKLGLNKKNIHNMSCSSLGSKQRRSRALRKQLRQKSSDCGDDLFEPKTIQFQEPSPAKPVLTAEDFALSLMQAKCTAGNFQGTGDLSPASDKKEEKLNEDIEVAQLYGQISMFDQLTDYNENEEEQKGKGEDTLSDCCGEEDDQKVLREYRHRIEVINEDIQSFIEEDEDDDQENVHNLELQTSQYSEKHWEKQEEVKAPMNSQDLDMQEQAFQKLSAKVESLSQQVQQYENIIENQNSLLGERDEQISKLKKEKKLLQAILEQKKVTEQNLAQEALHFKAQIQKWLASTMPSSKLI